MAKQEFLSKSGLGIYDEEIKGYIENSVDSANTFATQADATVLSEANAYSETLAAKMGLNKYGSSISWNASETVYTETWVYDGKSYKQVYTEVSDTQFTKQLYIDDVLVGLWTMTIDETNMIANTVYTAQ